jgi:hypothetical protein
MKIARLGSIGQRHGSADPDPDPYQKCLGSGTLVSWFLVHIYRTHNQYVYVYFPKSTPTKDVVTQGPTDPCWDH